MSNGNGGTAIVQRANEPVTVSAFSGESESFQVAQRMAKGLAASSIVPKDYQGNMANVMVAMEYAHRIGASVLSVMQNLDVIHGRPSLRSTFLIACVNASGRFTPIRFRWIGERGTDGWGCYAVATDRESGEECIGPEVTIQTAKDEGWYSKSGSKWKTIPQLMLMYRAGGWWSRVYCPELSLGMHTSDEMEDIAPPAAERVRNVAAALDAGDRPQLAPAALNESVVTDEGEPVDTTTGEVTEHPAATGAALTADSARADLETAISTMSPRGGDASDAQRDKIRSLAVAAFGDSDLKEALFELADAEKLGKGQAGLLIGKIQLAQAALAGAEA